MQKYHPPQGRYIPDVLGHFNPVFLSVYEQMSCHREDGKHHEYDVFGGYDLFKRSDRNKHQQPYLLKWKKIW